MKDPDRIGAFPKKNPFSRGIYFWIEVAKEHIPCLYEYIRVPLTLLPVCQTIQRRIVGYFNEE
jgi:hypothetical protein